MIKTLILPRHVGKTEHLLQRLEDLHIKEDGVAVPVIIHAISREEVESQRTERLTVKSLGRRPAQLRRAAGKCIYSVLGYEHEEEELFLIPEVRAYFKLASSIDPHWLFSCQLTTPSVMMIVLCCLQSFTCIRSSSTVCVTYHTRQMRELLDSWTPFFQKLQRISKMQMSRDLLAFRKSLGVP